MQKVTKMFEGNENVYAYMYLYVYVYLYMYVLYSLHHYN